MRFRPCIDIHNGQVKQIVGDSLKDKENAATENFVADKDAAYFADLFRKDGLTGGHVILLNPKDSPYYEATRTQALKALSAYPNGLQLGGGVNADNAEAYLKAGASHVIVTSYVFAEGQIQWAHMDALRAAVGKEHVVLDVSCRRKDTHRDDAPYYIVTNRWQEESDVALSPEVLRQMEPYCDEFLVHGVAVEGKKSGVDAPLVKLLSSYDGVPVTYAGGIASMQDLLDFADLSGGKLDFTIGSALDLYGGNLPYKDVVRFGADGRF